MLRPSDDNYAETALEISVGGDHNCFDDRIIPHMAASPHGTFDPYDKNSWFFGDISRETADEILKAETQDGVFLVRSSATQIGSYVLCVRESGRESNISHYIIAKVASEDVKDGYKYQIGTQLFPDIPTLLYFYRSHYLESTPLIRPAPRNLEEYVAKFDFEPREPDDLGFRKGDILKILRKEDEGWWTARNIIGSEGKIPYNYVEPYDESKNRTRPLKNKDIPSDADNRDQLVATVMPKTLPAFARVKRARNPCAYDKTALRLEVGDIIKVTKINASGTWEGELVEKRKFGFFPFTYIEWIDDGQSGAVVGRNGHESANESLSTASSSGSGDLKSDFRGSTDPIQSGSNNRFSSGSADWQNSPNGLASAPRPSSLNQ